MARMSKPVYWVAALAGSAAWSGAIVGVTNMPMMVQAALGGMGLVAAIWGHSVYFPREEREAALLAAEIAAGRAPAAPAALPVGKPRTIVSRQSRDAIMVAGNPPLLTHPFEEAARMEARRLSEAMTAAGVFGPVTVTLDEDGSAIIAPVQAREGVRVPVDTVLRFVTYAIQADGLVAEGSHAGGQWPGKDLKAAMDAHIAAALPAPPTASATAGQSAAGMIGAAPRPATPGWATPHTA